MTAIDVWLRAPAARAIGWALLQFLWQGAGVALLTALALLALRRSASDVRYVVSSIALAVMLTLTLVTGVQRYQSLRSTTASAAAVGTLIHDRVRVAANGDRFLVDPLASPGTSRGTRDGAEGSTAASDVAAIISRLRGLGTESLLPTLMLIWLGGVSILSLRLLTGWLWVQRLRTRGVAPVDDIVRRMAARLGRRLHVTRTVTLLESALVEVPTVIGFLKPVVLLPAAALAGLTAQQVEAILAHELAHVRRHDYLVNLLQTLVETVLFYHPAVWWLSRRIRIERENCCDDLAVSLCGDPVAYAAALADLEALRSSGPTPERHVAMAATGGSLLHRVRRLLAAPSSHSGRGPGWLAGGAALVLVGGIALGAADAGQATLGVVASTRPQNPVPVEAGAPIVPGAQRSTAAAPVTAVTTPAFAAPALAAVLTAGQAEAAVPPIAPQPSTQASVSHRVDNSHGTWSWSNNGDRLEVSYAGTFEFTDDDTDLRQLSAGGWMKISDGRWLGRHSVEIRERGGALERRYFVNASERPFEPEGRAWLRENLPKFVRNTGIGADARVARLLKSGGASAVMAEIRRIDSTYVKGVYFTQLFRQASLTGDQYRQAMTQASREMHSSSYELAQLLISAAARLPDDEASRAAYFEAASGIDSDYELRRVYSTMLKRGPVSPSVLAGILATAKSIQSDYDLSELLRQIMSEQALDERNRTAFFNAVATIGSGYERHRVLGAVISSQHASDAGLLASALAAAAALRSDYETSQFLQEVLRQNGVEGPVRAPFFAAVNTIGSNYERGHVLQAVIRKPGTSPDTLRAVLQSAKAMNGYDLSQLLQLMAATHVIGGDLRDAYLDAADRLSGYDQGQVMTALVKSERRK